ncbi:hypothetical protein TNCV_3898561 [Trichonephila clavipes]|nr:hypothetical protein TNCV_3898561 [Trichonephila clavipes]
MVGIKDCYHAIKEGLEGGNALRKHAGERGRNTTPLEDSYVALVVKKEQTFNSSPDSCNPCNHYHVKSDSSHQLLRRERGTRDVQKFVWDRDRYGPGEMVWAGIMLNSRTSLHIFERRSIT